MSKAKKYIKDFTNHCSNGLMFGGCAPWISPENALDAVDIEREEVVKKAAKWIKENADKYIEIKDGELQLKKSLCVDFKKAIK